MKRFLANFLKEILSVSFAYVVAIVLFVLSYLFIPDYWFVCGIFATLAAAVFDAFVIPAIKKKR